MGKLYRRMATRHSRMVFPRPLRHLVLIIALIALTASVAAAHVPQFSGGGEGLDNARVVNDPTKSWVIYTTYDGPDHVDYYKMSFKEGELMLVGVIVPVTEGERGLAPSMVLMGPGLDDNGTIPSPVQRADGGFMSLDPEEPSKPVYEPFSPSAFYELISIEMLAPADGDYYVAIYDGEIGGDYGLVVGKRESFTVVEWLTTPISLLTVYRWEGQQWWTILMPGALAFLIGMSAAYVRLWSSRRRADARWLLISLSGSLMIASAAVFGYQMVSTLLLVGEIEPAALLSVVFTIVPLLLGVAALGIAHRSTYGAFRPRSRFALLIIAVLGLTSWSGWIIGPALAALAAFLPSRSVRSRR